MASAPAVWPWICPPGLQSCLPGSAWSLFPWGSISLPTGSIPFPGFLPKCPESFSPTRATSCALLKQRVCDSQGARQGLWSGWGRGEGEVWGGGDPQSREKEKQREGSGEGAARGQGRQPVLGTLAPHSVQASLPNSVEMSSVGRSPIPCWVWALSLPPPSRHRPRGGKRGRVRPPWGTKVRLRLSLLGGHTSRA